ncbi:MAG TPA: hypothetical protein VHC21_02145 [Candidatus Saccharimonadales bacterium]|nr:hypothetical protein [Candidatus Saccharimonadales bacterium]
MSHDEFTQLFHYMEGKFGAIDKRFDKVEGDIRDIKFDLAELAGRVEDHYNEFLALGHKVDRIEGWTHEIAEHTGAPLSPA